jgi:hypothetical protein
MQTQRPWNLNFKESLKASFIFIRATGVTIL